MSLFGHHHADPTLTGKIGAFVHGIPVPIWVAVLGVIAAIAAPFVQHLFDRSRDRALAVASEQRRALDLRRTTARVRADLLVRVRAHLVLLGAAATRGEIDPMRWAAAFEALAARSRDAEVIDALGPAFADFAGAVHRELIALETARASVPDGHSVTAQTADLSGVTAAYERVLRDLAGADRAPRALETAGRRAR